MTIVSDMLLSYYAIVDGFAHCLYNRICSLLNTMGIMSTSTEYARGIGLIIGGTEAQPIHFDVPETPTNQDDYKRVMRLPNAPASILLGFGGCPVRICVPEYETNRIYTDENKRYCELYKGIPDEQFEIVDQESIVQIRKTAGEEFVEEKVDVVTLESDHGFIFRGDFNHAGARIATDEVTSSTWDMVHDILSPLTFNKLLFAGEFKSIFTKLCDVPYLDRITRLHVCVFPKDEAFDMPEDMVGYNQTLSDNEIDDGGSETPSDKISKKDDNDSGLSSDEFEFQ